MDLRFAVLHIFSRRHNLGICSLLGCWTVGVLLGVSFAFFADHSVLLMMRGWCYLPASIVDLLIVCFLPLLLSAFAVYLNEPWALFPIAFFKAFAFGICGCLICRSFGTAGWLACSLLQFSGWTSSVLLMYFDLKAVIDRSNALARFPWFAIILLVVALVDLYVVAPVLTGALNG